MAEPRKEKKSVRRQRATEEEGINILKGKMQRLFSHKQKAEELKKKE